ncbi:Flp pilus assembly protein TadG [Geodermatophilus bullaregiensis]|uniref:pilus assembly protein TadG-related protein n=1 Tax=Geodermatophilus bullaregiensis TaxID=1564160 RepID=UPI0027DE6796|nr:pilus assembly protein TadG-related protein [Geodermatophilus bullaregiensis]MBM7804938.1 Flp pilus assembly protein TadG [Geodermatophilus bullaregiensis]
MRRLTGHPLRRLRGRLDDERGASAVLLSLLMVPMLGFAAIAVDVGAVYAEKSRLQVAADAAALAVAQDCARGACGDVRATAATLVAANAGTATAAPPVLSSRPTSVTVTGNQPTEHWFAPVLGIDATAVSATATVAWGAPGGGTAVLPLTFSWCEFAQQTGGGLPSGTTVRTIRLTKTSGTTDCTGPSRNIVPGGFGYLVTDPGQCRASSAVAGRSTSSTGNSPPADCSTADFTRWLGRTVLLPIFDEFGDTGSNAWYRVHGYAAFRITGFHLGGQFSTSPRPCTGNDRCITGYFTRFVELSDDFTLDPDAPDLGSAVLRLIR